MLEGVEEAAAAYLDLWRRSDRGHRDGRKAGNMTDLLLDRSVLGVALAFRAQFVLHGGQLAVGIRPDGCGGIGIGLGDAAGFRQFQREGVWDTIWAELHMALHERLGREASPTAAVLDSQSLKSAEKGAVKTTKWVTTPARR